MENFIPKIEKTLKREVVNFIELGAIMDKVEEQKPWIEDGLTKSQWLAGEATIPAHTANQAREAYLYLEAFSEIDDIGGLTVGKIKLILPYLKEMKTEDQIDLVRRAKTMLYNDLRDSLLEKDNDEECEPDEWEHKEYWRCPKNGKRIYNDPTIKN